MVVTAEVDESAGYRSLAREVRDAGLLAKRPGYYAVKIGANVAALGALLAGVALLGNSWWQVPVAVGLAFVFTQLAFMGHDAGHGQICRGRRGNHLIGFVHANLLTGFSYGWWLNKHNAHHTHCNRDGRDPDIGAGVLAMTRGQADERRGLARILTKAQAVLLLPLLLLEAANLHVASVKALRGRGLRAGALEGALLVGHAAAYTALMVISGMDAAHLAVFILLNQGLFGLYLGLAFVTNHMGMPVLEEADELSFLHRQVLTSRNVRSSRIMRFLLGGLEHQIEHHLFPAMPRANLWRAARLVRPFCDRHAISYHERSPLRAYHEVLSYLHGLGRRRQPWSVVG